MSLALSLSLLTFNKGRLRLAWPGEGCAGLFVLKRTVALPLSLSPYLSFEFVNSAIVKSSPSPPFSPPPTPATPSSAFLAGAAGRIDLLRNRGRIIRKNRARQSASHLRRNKFSEKKLGNRRRRCYLLPSEARREGTAEKETARVEGGRA